MTRHPPKTRTEFNLLQLLPNMLTITAISAGMTAIRFGIQGNYALAMQLILAACILDGLDGRLARRLGGGSDLGAELDSLADFLNFGVAPGLVIFFWALQDMPGTGWIFVLFYAVCCVMRLARFNVSSRSENAPGESRHFTGVPAPAGALLVTLPMSASFAFANAPLVPDLVICGFLAGVGLLMISRIPTPSPKSVRISRENVPYVLVGLVAIGGAVLTYAWTTLVVLCLAYVATVIWALLRRDKPEQD